MKFSKNSYVVLLHSSANQNPNAWEESGMPINYVYKLAEDIDSNRIEINIVKNLKGDKARWKVHRLVKGKNYFKHSSALLLRPASQEEIDSYNRNGGPVETFENILFIRETFQEYFNITSDEQ